MQENSEILMQENSEIFMQENSKILVQENSEFVWKKFYIYYLRTSLNACFTKKKKNDILHVYNY